MHSCVCAAILRGTLDFAKFFLSLFGPSFSVRVNFIGCKFKYISAHSPTTARLVHTSYLSNPKQTLHEQDNSCASTFAVTIYLTLCNSLVPFTFMAPGLFWQLIWSWVMKWNLIWNAAHFGLNWLCSNWRTVMEWKLLLPQQQPNWHTLWLHHYIHLRVLSHGQFQRSSKVTLNRNAKIILAAAYIHGRDLWLALSWAAIGVLNPWGEFNIFFFG